MWRAVEGSDQNKIHKLLSFYIIYQICHTLAKKWHQPRPLRVYLIQCHKDLTFDILSERTCNVIFSQTATNPQTKIDLIHLHSTIEIIKNKFQKSPNQQNKANIYISPICVVGSLNFICRFWAEKTSQNCQKLLQWAILWIILHFGHFLRPEKNINLIQHIVGRYKFWSYFGR